VRTIRDSDDFADCLEWSRLSGQSGAAQHSGDRAMSKKSKPDKADQAPLEIELPQTTYQPSMAQVREKFDMPAASPE